MIKEIIVTPEHEAIEDAADFIGIEPERMAAAIGLYKNHTRSVLTTVPDEAIVKRVAGAMRHRLRELWPAAYKNVSLNVFAQLATAAIAAMGQQPAFFGAHHDAVIAHNQQRALSEDGLKIVTEILSSHHFGNASAEDTLKYLSSQGYSVAAIQQQKGTAND